MPGKFGYNEIFDQWSVADAQDMVLRDRNHPCIIMWSIANEVDYANDPYSHPVLGEEYKPENPSAEKMLKCAAPLIEVVKKLDGSRTVTAALANVEMSDAVGLGDMLGIVGYNYQEQRYAADHKKHPRRFIFGSENHHTYSAWLAVRDNEYICGQFLWTGIDYLGEAGRWPNRANGFGLLDLCGYKKPLAWFRQSLWSDKPMVYICAATSGGERPLRATEEENWNWTKDKTITVHCYTNCPEVLLTLNDKSMGSKKLAEATGGVLTWQVPFEPGVLKAVGRRDGKTVCQYDLKTAGAASRIELTPDVTELALRRQRYLPLGIPDYRRQRRSRARRRKRTEIRTRGSCRHPRHRKRRSQRYDRLQGPGPQGLSRPRTGYYPVEDGRWKNYTESILPRP